MILEPNWCSDAPELTTVSYAFLEPAMLRLRKPDGSIVVLGFGIGEQVDVVVPRIQTLQAQYELRKEIPLADGSFILGTALGGHDDLRNLRYRRVWKGAAA